MEIPEGFVLTPLIPDEKMIAAGNAAEARVELIYDAMVKARPTPSLFEQGEFPELDDELPTIQGE